METCGQIAGQVTNAAILAGIKGYQAVTGVGMYLVGQLIGGFLAVYLFQWFWEFAVFKRVLDDPVRGKLSSAVGAYLTVSILSGFGGADGGPYWWPAFILYLFPALLVGALAYRRGLALRGEGGEIGEIEETFR